MSKEDVTNAGSGDEDIAGDTSALHPRDEAVNDIVAKARAKRNSESPELEGGDPGEELQVNGGDADDLGDTDDPKLEVLDQPEMVTVSINGKEKQVSQSKIDEAGGLDIYQKNASASERLRLAAEREKRTDEEAAKLKRDQDEFERQRQENLDAAAKENDRLSDEDVGNDSKLSDEELTAQLYSGEQSEVMKAVHELRRPAKSGIQPGTALTPEEKEEIENRAAARAEWNIERRQAMSDYKSDYKDVSEDPVQHDYCNSHTAILYKEHPDWGPRKIIMESAKITRNKYAVKAEPADPSKEDEAEKARINAEKENRLSRKRATDSVVANHGKQPAKAVPKALTRSEVVAQAQTQRSGYQS